VQKRAGLILPSLFTLAMLAVLIGLGTWQLQRKTWKEALIDTLDRRLTAEPAALPPAERWGALTPDNDEFSRVHLSATLPRDDEALVYSSGSALRSDVSGPGYWVFAPARLPDGATVVVDRGFIPESKRDPQSHRAPDGPLAMIGIMRWPESRGSFTPNDDPAHNLWFVRDPPAMARAKGWGDVAPFYIEVESPSGPNGFPRAGKVTVNLPDNHLQYAITWFGLAAALAIGFAFWVRSNLRPAP
jgi:surfeit locus 1 family protein